MVVTVVMAGRAMFIWGSTVVFVTVHVRVLVHAS
jgi:hypothetical protein